VANPLSTEVNESRPLCARGCTFPDDNPRPAAPGLWVCLRCEHQVRAALRDLPGLWADLGDTRRGKRLDNSAPSAEKPPPLSDDARNARSAIKAALVAWCFILDEDFGMSLPADTVRAMAHHVAVQTGRLLASEHADQLVHDVVTAAREARRLAYPVSSLTVECSCGCRVRIDQDPDVRTTCAGCGEAGTSTWWLHQLVPDALQPMTAEEGVAWLANAHRIQVSAEMIRQWAARGHVVVVDHKRPEGQPYGRPASRYMPLALIMAATRSDRARWMVATPDPNAIVTLRGA
jgi:hypothetical protein